MLLVSLCFFCSERSYCRFRLAAAKHLLGRNAVRVNSETRSFRSIFAYDLNFFYLLYHLLFFVTEINITGRPGRTRVPDKRFWPYALYRRFANYIEKAFYKYHEDTHGYIQYRKPPTSTTS